jgi:hypothetical protein
MPIEDLAARGQQKARALSALSAPSLQYSVRYANTEADFAGRCHPGLGQW